MIECTVCMENYDTMEHTPRNLNCGHTFCDDCMKNLRAQSVFTRRNNRLSCPTCKKFTVVNAASTWPLSKNYAVIDALTAMNPAPNDYDGLMAKLHKCSTCNELFPNHKLMNCTCSPQPAINADGQEALKSFCVKCLEAQHVGHVFLSVELNRMYREVKLRESVLVFSSSRLTGEEIAQIIAALPPGIEDLKKSIPVEAAKRRDAGLLLFSGPTPTVQSVKNEFAHLLKITEKFHAALQPFLTAAPVASAPAV